VPILDPIFNKIFDDYIKEDSKWENGDYITAALKMGVSWRTRRAQVNTNEALDFSRASRNNAW